MKTLAIVLLVFSCYTMVSASKLPFPLCGKQCLFDYECPKNHSCYFDKICAGTCVPDDEFSG